MDMGMQHPRGPWLPFTTPIGKGRHCEKKKEGLTHFLEYCKAKIHVGTTLKKKVQGGGFHRSIGPDVAFATQRRLCLKIGNRGGGKGGTQGEWDRL